jgi:hypothetical protein
VTLACRCSRCAASTHSDNDTEGHGVAGVLAWSAIPVGALAGGWAVERTGSVALVYAVIGAVVALLELAFSFGPAGHPERYLPAGQPAPADTP